MVGRLSFSLEQLQVKADGARLFIYRGIVPAAKKMLRESGESVD